MGILNLLAPEQLNQYQSEVGGKTTSLKRLMDAEFNVPEFRAIPSSTLSLLIDDHGRFNESFLPELTQKIIREFPKALYAVRSSALTEDTSEHTFAGQFKTEIHQTSDQLAAAIKEVIQHAYEFLKNDFYKNNLCQFSLIIQEYIEADYSGITFTRSPLGGREMTIEFHQGIGEDIVSGSVTPEKYSLYWSEQPQKLLPGIENALKNFKRIEQVSKAPQDVEWCIKNNTWYFLQSRPITTLSKNDYAQSLYLDEFFKDRTEFMLEKTEISEIAPRPTPITLDILQRIYAENGPVQNVYKKYSIIYTPHNFIEIVGNELFVNREQEITTLLPSYSYLKNSDYKPSFAHFSGMWTTLKSIFRLQKISLQPPEILLEKLIVAFKNDMSTIDAFMRSYELIFEINLLAQKALSMLEFALQKESISPAAALTLDFENKDNLELPDGTVDLSSLQGNALEVSDTSPFVAANLTPRETAEARQWYEQLPEFKKSYLLPIIQKAKEYSALREYGRWLTVAHISGIRKSNPVPELASSFLKYNAYNFPSRLTSRYVPDLKKLQGVSAGPASGTLINRETLDKNSDTSSDFILYTKILSPDLTEYFPRIKGIVSEDGGLLSHLAIMARESGIPVIVNIDLARDNLKLGDIISINGSNGEMRKVLLDEVMTSR